MSTVLTGIEPVDKLVGPIPQSSVLLIKATPQVYYHALMVRILAHSVLQGEAARVVSLEDDPSYLLDLLLPLGIRWEAAKKHVDLVEVNSFEELERSLEGLERFSRVVIDTIGSTFLTDDMLTRAVRRVMQVQKLLYLFVSTSAHGPRTMEFLEKVAEVVLSLKRAAEAGRFTMMLEKTKHALVPPFLVEYRVTRSSIVWEEISRL